MMVLLFADVAKARPAYECRFDISFGPIVPYELRLDYNLERHHYVDAQSFSYDKFLLGKNLFFDKVLSGNKDIACGTCHHPSLATADGLSLSVGTGGEGLGPKRTTGNESNNPIVRRMSRNALALFGVGHERHTVAFVDGRVHPLENGSFATPAGDDLPVGLDNIVAAAAMFPIQPHEEMSGEPGSNPIADAAGKPDFPRVWALLATRLRGIPEYVGLFRKAFGIEAHEIQFVHVANALAAFIIEFGRVTTTPFERYIAGDPEAMSSCAKKGAEIFFGKGRCVSCHSGPLFSDMRFHAIGVPQVGPGRGHGWRGVEDLGRAGVTGDSDDDYEFRTPILLNIGLTAPYGHAGQFATLEAVIRHHTAPYRMHRYRCGLRGKGGQLVMPSRADLDDVDCLAHGNPDVRNAILDASILKPPRLSEREILDLVAFLTEGLTDKRFRLIGVHPSVPSGLPVD